MSVSNRVGLTFDPAEPDQKQGNDDELHHEGKTVRAGRGAALNGAKKAAEPANDHDQAQASVKTAASIEVDD